MSRIKKRKLFIMTISLLLCFSTLILASFAWLSLSATPEITGIKTQVGANGSLEIALLDETTYLDPSVIRTSVGDSQMAQEAVKSNLSWGNVVDLSDPAYGLSEIAMMPARLNAVSNGEDGGVVRSGFLSTMEFGSDGRAKKVRSETVSAVFSEKGFFYDSEKPGYGVRGIGSVPQMSPQQSALTNAKSLVGAYVSTASGIAESAWGANGDEILDIYLRHYLLDSTSFNNADVTAVRDTVMKAQTAFDYIDAALRQGIIGYAASEMTDPELFRTLRDNVENPSLPLSMLLKMAPVNLPKGFSEWIVNMESSRTALKKALIDCNKLQGKSSVSWEELSPITEVLIKGNKVFLGEYRLASADAFAEMADGTVLTISPGSGAFAELADYIGNYSVFFDYAQVSGIEVKTTSAVSPPHLRQLAQRLEECECAVPDGSVTEAEIEDIYGFAADMVFRSNADTQLLLQTEAVARVEDGSEEPKLLGNGSYMSMTSEQLNTKQIVRLMDAVRVAFLDSQNRILAVSKLNTSNYAELETGVQAPLYLYDYEILDDGTLLMGERSENAVILDLPDGAAMTVTMVVWLDGDHVDNSLAAIRNQSVQGALNLQFASSVHLMPAKQTVEISD